MYYLGPCTYNSSIGPPISFSLGRTCWPVQLTRKVQIWTTCRGFLAITLGPRHQLNIFIPLDSLDSQNKILKGGSRIFTTYWIGFRMQMDSHWFQKTVVSLSVYKEVWKFYIVWVIFKGGSLTCFVKPGLLPTCLSPGTIHIDLDWSWCNFESASWATRAGFPAVAVVSQQPPATWWQCFKKWIGPNVGTRLIWKKWTNIYWDLGAWNCQSTTKLWSLFPGDASSSLQISSLDEFIIQYHMFLGISKDFGVETWCFCMFLLFLWFQWGYG